MKRMNHYMNSIHCIKDKHCWIAGDNGITLFSVDGGNTFTKQKTNTTMDLTDIVFKDKLTGVAVYSRRKKLSPA